MPSSAFVTARTCRTVPSPSRSYERWGERFLDRMVGVFALAIVDRLRGGVLLARDHVGDRPLVVHERARSAGIRLQRSRPERVRGSRSRARRSAGRPRFSRPHIPRSKPQFVASVASSGDGGLGRCRRRPKVALVGARSTRGRRRQLPGSTSIAFARRSTRSVAAMLRSSGGVCSAVSGGLDSTSVAATAARALAGSPLRTYTLAPPIGWEGPVSPGWDADESGLVLDLADMHPNIDPVFLREANLARLFTLQGEFWERGGAPFFEPCNALWANVMFERVVRDGSNVQLVGESGNAFFSADGPQWLLALLRRGRVLEAGRESLAWHRASGQLAPVTFRELLPELLPRGFRRWVDRLRGGRALRRWRSRTPLREEIAADLDLSSLCQCSTTSDV